MVIKELIKSIKINLDLSKEAYKEYLKTNNSYLFAQLIYKYNIETRELLSKNITTLPCELVASAQKLIFYYDVWSLKWNSLNDTKLFQLKEPFIFENDYTFPKDASKAFETFYSEQIK